MFPLNNTQLRACENILSKLLKRLFQKTNHIYWRHQNTLISKSTDINKRFCQNFPQTTVKGLMIWFITFLPKHYFILVAEQKCIIHWCLAQIISETFFVWSSVQIFPCLIWNDRSRLTRCWIVTQTMMWGEEKLRNEMQTHQLLFTFLTVRMKHFLWSECAGPAVPVS